MASYKLEDVVYENGNFWVLKVGTGSYEVYESGITHSTRRDIVHYSQQPELALQKAIEKCGRRAMEQQK